VRGADLNELICEDFEVQGVRFHGTEECRPCYWMDRAIAPGAHEFLKGRGGLRAKILSDGRLCSSGDAILAGARESSVASPSTRERAG
jgi:MOSC domain-containing protein YiiM